MLNMMLVLSNLSLLRFNWFSLIIFTYGTTIFYWSHTIEASSSNNINTKYPLKRNFIPLPGTYALNPNNDPVTFRVLQLNVLADGLSGRRPDLGYFSRITSPEVLDWHSRKTKLLHEITQYHPDVITMQEVDHYYDFFFPEMNKLGYSGYFAPKPTSACLDNLQPLNSTADGCVLFIKRKKFKVISCETKTLALSVAGLSEGELLEDDLNIKAQNQVALFAVCEFNTGDEDEYDDETNTTTNSQSASNNNNDNNNSNDSNSKFNLFGSNDNTPRRPKPPPPLLICTTHLKSAKTAVGELYRQKAILQVLDKVENLYCKFADTGRTPAVLLTGDFNAVPEIASYAPPLTYEAVKIHSLLFRSIYNDDAKFSLFPLSNNPLYTTWKARNLPPGVDSQFPGNQMMIPRNWTAEDWTTNFMAVAANEVIGDSENNGFSSTGYGSLFGPYISSSNNTDNSSSKNNNNNGKNGNDVEESVVKRCIDYIFYCPFISKNLKISDALRIKDDEEVSRLLGEDVIDEEMEFYSTGDYLSSSSSSSSASLKLNSSGFISDGMISASSSSSNGLLEDRDESIISDEEEEEGEDDDDEVDDIEEYNNNDDLDSNNKNNAEETTDDEVTSKKKRKRRKKMKDKLMVGHPTTVFSTEQVTLSLSLRYVVYFLNSLLPITALVYSDMPLNEILQVTGMALFGLFCFEYMMAVKPTPFNPVIPSQIKIDIENVAVLPTTAGRRISRQKLVNKATAMGKNMLTRSGLYLTGRPGLQPVALLDIFTDEEVGEELFPSIRYPSDHLAIAADFQVLWDKNEEYSGNSNNNNKWDDDGSGGDGGSNNSREGNDSGMVSDWSSVDEFNGSSSNGDDSSNNFDRKQQ